MVLTYTFIWLTSGTDFFQVRATHSYHSPFVPFNTVVEDVYRSDDTIAVLAWNARTDSDDLLFYTEIGRSVFGPLDHNLTIDHLVHNYQVTCNDDEWPRVDVFIYANTDIILEEVHHRISRSR